jgi:SAM-dependent methyltransferase
MTMKKLNMGCGLDIQEGYINQDISPFKGVDNVFDFNQKEPWPYEDDTYDEIRIKDCIHCAENSDKFMAEVYRIAKPNALVIVEGVNFLSPICCQDPYFKTRLGYNTFDMYLPDNKSGYYNTPTTFIIEKRKWIISSRKLKFLNFIPNIYPKFYTRFLYFYFPANIIHFELRVVKEDKNG